VAACGQGPFCPGNVVLVPQPDETLAVVCGQAVDHPCEQSVDTTNVGACGSPALCPGGVALVPQPADDLATACGNAVPNPCKSVDPANVAACGYGPFCVGGASSVDTTNVAACGRPAACPGGAYLVQQPDDTLAVVCGMPVDHPCEQSVDTTNVGACGSPALCPGNVVLVPQPDDTLAVVCGKPIDHPCEQSVDTWHVAACGAVGPVCEDGAYALDGNGRPTRACNEAVPGACPEPVAFPPDHLLAVCGVPVDAPCPESVDTWHVAACGLVEPVCPEGAYALDGNGVPTEACGEPVPKPCPESVDPWHVAACGADPVCPDGAYELDGDNWPMTVCGEPWPCQEVVGPVAPGQPIVVCGQPLPNLVPPGVVPDCMDGLDNDGDGRADFRPVGVGGGDPGCFTPLDDDEVA
jgi:hypothetical protein